MDKLFIFFVILVSLPFLTNMAMTFSGRKKLVGPFEVTKVFDGDTLEAVGPRQKVFKVRLLGIDAPEAGNEREGRPAQPYSERSEKYLRKAVEDQPVYFRGYGIDQFGRLLAEVFTDEKNINLELLRAGLAEVYRGRLEDNFDPEPYWKTEEEARKSREGMWSMGDKYVSPREWRRYRGWG